MLNVGPTRADTLENMEKIELPSGTILRDVVRSVLSVPYSRYILTVHECSPFPRGPKAVEEANVRRMLTSGVVQPPLDDE